MCNGKHTHTHTHTHTHSHKHTQSPPPAHVCVARSMQARALATSCAVSFFSISGAQIFSPYVGDSERAVRAVFDRARKSAPSILFLDEVDAIVGSRSGTEDGQTVGARVLSTVLNEMDGIEALGRVIVVAATNRCALCCGVCGRERETDRQTERETQRDTERHRETETQRHRETQRDTERQRLLRSRY